MDLTIRRRSLVLAVLAVVFVAGARRGHASYFEHYRKVFGDFAYSAEIFDGGDPPANAPPRDTLGEMRRHVEDTVTIHCNTVLAAKEIFS